MYGTFMVLFCLFWKLDCFLSPSPFIEWKKAAWKRKGSQQEGEWMMIEISCLGDLNILERELGKLSFAQIYASQHVFAQICSMTDTDDIDAHTVLWVN